MSAHDTTWMARAACAGRLDLPWTLDAAGVTPWQAATMQSICDGCPVLFDCLNAVDDLDVTGGWWAGRDRDPHADLAHLAPPAWATDGTAAVAAAARLSSRPAGRSVQAGQVARPVPRDVVSGHDTPAPTLAAALASSGLGVAWVPVTGKRGRVLGEQAAFTFDGLAGVGVA